MTDYKEKFEKMRVAGKLASKTLDMLTDYIKPGVSTDKIDIAFINELYVASIKFFALTGTFPISYILLVSP